MALTDTTSYKLWAGIADASQDPQIGALCSTASAVINRYCKADLETPASPYVEFPAAANTPELVLRRRPVKVFGADGSVTGTVTAGSATITAVTSTAGLYAGAAVGAWSPAAGLQPALWPSPVTVLSFTGTTVTASAAAAAGLAGAQLVFGPAVYLSPGSYWGQGPGSFPAAALLRIGRDYALEVDQPDGVTSRSGKILRLGGAPAGGLPWEREGAGRCGTLTAASAPTWPGGHGASKVVYAAGWGSNPPYNGGTLPYDLTDAANMLVS